LNQEHHKARSRLVLQFPGLVASISLAEQHERVAEIMLDFINPE